jgi:hypothetical protein
MVVSVPERNSRNHVSEPMTTTASNRLTPGNAEHKSSSGEEEKHPVDDLVQYVTDYCRERPEIAALWCLGVGFVLAWKLKPW